MLVKPKKPNVIQIAISLETAVRLLATDIKHILKIFSNISSFIPGYFNKRFFVVNLQIKYNEGI